FPCGGEVHCLGEVWSSALWSTRAQLGGTAADRLVLQSQLSLPFNATFQQGSRALLVADAALYAGAHTTFLRDLLTSRGLLDVEHLDDTPADAVPITIPARITGRLDS